MKKLSYDQAKQKALHYCAYQERCHQEVKNKLYELGLSTAEVNELLTFLITEGFLNEERYAKQFAGGKFRMKKWGRYKIEHALEAKGLTKNCIRIGLKEIEEEEYQKTLHEILQAKMDATDNENIFALRDQVAKYAIQKGYEPELVWSTIKSLIPG